MWLLVLVVASTMTSAPTNASGWTRPPFTPLFQYQLQTGSRGPGGIDSTLCATTRVASPCLTPRVIDIDLYGPDGTTPNVAAVRALHARGVYVICYVDAGTWESWRPDATRYPRALLGRPNGWPGERWLDIRRLSTLLPILDARVRACARAGFNAVEFDNVDGYQNSTGFALSARDQLRFNESLAVMAHRFGLAAGLKNDVDQVSVLDVLFDFGVDEQCVAYHQCGPLRGFLERGRPVYDVEYRGTTASLCSSIPRGLTVIVKSLALTSTPWGVCD